MILSTISHKSKTFLFLDKLLKGSNNNAIDTLILNVIFGSYQASRVKWENLSALPLSKIYGPSQPLSTSVFTFVDFLPHPPRPSSSSVPRHLHPFLRRPLLLHHKRHLHLTFFPPFFWVLPSSSSALPDSLT